MDALLHTLSNLWQTIALNINTALAHVPGEILCFGLIAGFLCSIPEKQPYSYREANKALFEIRRSSSILALITILSVAAYIFYTSNPRSVFYLTCSLLAGALIYMIIFRLLNLVAIIGVLFRNVCIIASGPVIIFMAWFFYTGELMQVIAKLLGKISAVSLDDISKLFNL